MIAGNVKTPFLIHLSLNDIAHTETTFNNPSLMDNNIRRNSNSIGNQKVSGSTAYLTGITRLSAHLSIKGGGFQDEACRLPLRYRLCGCAVNHEVDNN